jgi:hypothetical protein
MKVNGMSRYSLIIILFMLNINCDNSEKAICESEETIYKDFYCKELPFFLYRFEETRNPMFLRCLVAIEKAKKCKSKSPIKPSYW